MSGDSDWADKYDSDRHYANWMNDKFNYGRTEVWLDTGTNKIVIEDLDKYTSYNASPDVILANKTPIKSAGSPTPIKSDGSSTAYYKIPTDATDLIDLIEQKNMNFAVGNIFKACFRLGQKEGNDDLYDLRKIIFFAEREIKRLTVLK